jgi:hypothetical protein
MNREATLSSDKEVPSDIAAHCTQVGVKGSNKRCKQHPLGTTTMTSRDWEVGNSGMGHASATAHSNMRLVRLPTDHFKRLFEEACLNHAYPVKHKLNDCDMMRSFMTSGSLTWGVDLDEGLDVSDTTPFLEENAIMMVCEGHPLLGRHRMSSLGPRIPSHYGWGCRGSRV